MSDLSLRCDRCKRPQYDCQCEGAVEVMSGAQTPCPADHPLMKAWEDYRLTEDYTTSKHWALQIAPFVQAGSEAETRRLYEIMPFEQRSRHVEGSLWSAFMAGFAAAGGKITA